MVTSFFGALVGFDRLTQRFMPALVKSWVKLASYRLSNEKSTSPR